MQILRAGQGLQDSRRSAQSVPRVLLSLDDRRDHAGGVAAGPREIRADGLSDERVHLRPSRSRLARRLAETLLDQRRHVIMFAGDEATLIMPDEALPLGKWTPKDNFRVEQVFGHKGPTWRAAKI